MKINKGRGHRRDLAFEAEGAGQWEVQVGPMACELTFLRGGETVLAGRLAGKNTVVVRARATALTAATPHWQIRDPSNDQAFEITSILPSDCGFWLDFTCITEGR